MSLVGQAAASRFGAAGIDGAAPFLDVRDFAILVDHEGGPVRHSRLRNENAILLGDLAFGRIAQ